MAREQRAAGGEIRANAHGDETRRALVDATVRTVAAHGVGGASLRAINAAAGSKNASAAHYYFGSKLAVLKAAVESVYEQVLPQQEAGLGALEARLAAGEHGVSAREVLEAVYQPYFVLLLSPEFGQVSAKFISRLLIESDAEIQGLLNEMVAPQMLRVLYLLEAALPDLRREVLAVRLFVTVTNVVHGAGDFPALLNSPLGDLSGGDRAGALRRMMDYIVAGVCAPDDGT